MSTPASLNGKLVPAVSADPTFALAIAITGKIARRLCLQRDDYWKKGIVGLRQGTPVRAGRVGGTQTQRSSRGLEGAFSTIQ